MDDMISALEKELAADPYGRLHERLAMNDDELLEALVVLRRTKKLTQDQVAERMGRSKTAVSNFERLGADPHLSTIRRYAAAIGALISTRVEDYDLVRVGLEPIKTEYRHLPKSEQSDDVVAGVGEWNGTRVTLV
ncbi:helix-turn-helix domain-containing protein [Tsukamurella sp. PLM1]|uniref:helix-turn-helix domain-containing protein n=1 Tax=Tsukamurella sp. PLM1 TaxID=2929795 RepID=UPI0020BF3D28|nr:helix-turn-helix transcriptional regulator [Tsukamurella sp. PLM1]